MIKFRILTTLMKIQNNDWRLTSTLKVRQPAAQHEATRRSRIGAKKIEEARMYRGTAGDRHLVTRVAAS